MISVRLLSYNIRHCRGMDGRVSPERVAEVISACEVDLVALQEVDVGRGRTGGLDQAETIARRLGMDHHFQPALHLGEERYGDAILTRLPSRLIQAGILPGLANRPGLEPRGALWVEVTANRQTLQVFNTHLGLSARERMGQAQALLGPDWTGSPACASPFVLMGDFNAIPQSAAYRRLAAHLADARRIAGQRSGSATFPSRWPLLRIDHVFVGPGMRVRRMEVVRTGLARRASDHLPLLVELEIAPPSV
ncbi:MAG: endonuclease/exonuclease/phosphatase family protein [Methylobacterium sp.]|uniref:endonuclease/exonuclease/phosphatase family protein n=1 Tax=Methylobacterium sp. TaxID=409 RepID=UPI002721175E|nr:endonuclease/exonuclease/phosphatase family protein [Methylobacterium sp.]MDO9425236.1 endonuclease/exonuclease/phosphatase family protein [Methylobacterium sp.]